MSKTTDRVYEGAELMDSREVIEKLEELESLESGATEENPMDKDDADELKNLRALAKEGEDSPDWIYGEALIKDSYFEEYAQQLAEDIGAINKDQSWPNNCIDWTEAADQLKQDYFPVTYGSTEYWIRA